MKGFDSLINSINTLLVINEPVNMPKEINPRKVFVVHGRNSEARNAMFEFLRSIDLQPIEWSQAVKETGKATPYIGEILDTAFSSAQAIVVLMTPDELAILQEDFISEHDEQYEKQFSPQARPNVLFEAGMAIGRNADRTILVEMGKLRPFSDVGGRHTIKMNNNSTRRQEFADRLKSAGCAVNLDGTDWHNAGDFELKQKTVEIGTIKDLHSIKVFEPQGSKLNKDFYDYFQKRLELARSEIWITGEGFGFSDDSGVKQAQAYNDQMENALKRGVHITRFQTAEPCHPEWAKMLKKLCENYPDNFHLYIINNEDKQDIASVCVIDPEDDENNVAEFMLSAEKEFTNKPIKLASTAVFIHGLHKLTRAMRRNILVMKNFDVTDYIENPKDLDKFITTNYFAYGSNMSERQIKERCPSAKKISNGCAPGYELVFNRKGTYRPGGVASIEKSPNPDSRVFGVIWALSKSDFDKLDAIEDPTAYERVTLPINDDNNKVIECEVYIAYPEEGEIVPDPDYLELLINSAIEAKLPEDYIKTISNFRDE